MKPKPTHVQTSQELLAELQALIHETEAMIASAVAEGSEEAMSGLRSRLGAAQEKFSEILDGAKQKVIAGAKSTDLAIRENPYQSMAIALGVGILVGVVIGRRTA